MLTGIGFLVGCIGTLIGAGGGFILVPVLLLLFPGLRAEAITSISLGVVFLNAFSGTVAYARMKRIDYRSALLFALATLPGAIIGASLTSYIPRNLFDILLGVILIAVSAFLLIKPNYKVTPKLVDRQSWVHRKITDSKGQEYKYSFNIWTGIILSFFVGYLSSLLGIGGGIIHVPALTALLHFPIHVATATSHFILAIMALAGTIVHMIQGNLKGSWFTIIY
ncbi:MAG: sulfite exporter TauE/SafE family protein, partial [Flavisolibacter sp.]|nr:sulfite exporter TauE/SafE family protein [Flavisolibacter sp.]